jgi:hypothetical protein
MIDFFSIFKEVRDPAVFGVCVITVYWLNRNYVTKNNHARLENRVRKIEENFVSKEKLDDITQPINTQLKAISGQLEDIRKFFVDILLIREQNK